MHVIGLRFLLVCIFILVSGSLCFGAPTTKGKYLIQYGWDVPSSEYVRNNIAEMEKMPFDGITISDGLGWNAWTRNRLPDSVIADTVENLKATKFKRFKHNLIPLITYFKNEESVADWFEQKWSNIAHNSALLARAAKQGGCIGILFDAEQYGNYKMWNYAGALAERPFEEVAAKVHERGKEFIQAVNKEFPNIVILVLWAYELTIVYPGQGGEYPSYVLFSHFMDGIIEGADEGTVLVDGYEYAYGYISEKAFMTGRKMIKDTARNKVTTVPKAFDKHVIYGCPVYADMWSSQILPFDLDNPQNNLFTPTYFQTALHNAMRASDKYVWVYNEHLRWFGDDANAPKAYIDAIALSRKSAAPGEHPDKIAWPNVKLRLPVENWRFSEHIIGTSEFECTKADFDDSLWKSVTLGEVPEYSDKAWYRYKFTAPQRGENMREYLTIPTEDEFMRVWLNGVYLGRYDVNRHGKFGFYVIEISKAYRPGEDNVLALQMENTEGKSGITKALQITESGPASMPK